MRRFYKEAAAGSHGGGFAVLLDGRPVRTPLGRPLELPTRALAEAVAAEWAVQGDEVRPHGMGVMRLACTAIDRTADARAGLVDEMVRYAGSDLLCYRAEGPSDLVGRQDRIWQPLLDWLAATHGAILIPTRGIRHLAQPAESLERLRAVVDGLDDFRLTALAGATAAAGSLVIGLALVEGRIDAEAAFAAAQLDETYQMELWGEDEEAMARRASLKADLTAAARLVGALEG